MKKSLALVTLALVLACPPCAFGDHIPPMNPNPPSGSTTQPSHEDHASPVAEAAVSTAVQVILSLIARGVGG
jgi:hypothetical protein